MSYDLLVVNGDLSIKNGDLSTVVGSNKLSQDIVKICLTPVGASIFNPWYGSFISKNLIGSPLDTSITVTIAQNQLRDTIENLKKIQQLQQYSGLQSVTPDEHIAGISEIKVTRNAIDPREFNVTVKVLNKAFRQTTTNFPVSSF